MDSLPPADLGIAAIFEATRDVVAQHDWPTLLLTVVARTQSLLNAPAGALYLLEAARRDLELAAGEGFPRRVFIGEDVAGGVAQARQSLIVDDYSTWERRALLSEATDLKTVVGVPLLAHDDLVGALLVGDLSPARRFSETDVKRLMLFAEQVAHILSSRQRLDQAQRRQAELELLHKISTALRQSRTTEEIFSLLVKEVLAGLQTPAGSLWLYDPANDELVRVVAQDFHVRLPAQLKPHMGVAGRVFTTGQPYVAHEFVSDPYAHDSIRAQMPAGWGGAGVPLRVGDETVGVLLVTTQLPRELRPDEMNLLTTLAEIAGTALSQTRPQQEPRDRQRLASQRTIDTAITTSLDLNVTLSIILDQVIARLGVNAADVLLLNPESQLLEYAAGRGFYTETITRSRWRLGEGHAGRAALQRRPFSLPDLSQDEQLEHAPLVAAEGFHAYYGVPLIAKGRVKGVLEIFHRAPLQPNEEWLEFLEALAAQAAVAIDNALLFADLQRSNAELAKAYDTTLEGWSRALDLRDKETEGHTQRVTEMTLRLARAMGVNEADLVHIRRGALLHDIGKMGIPDAILLKPGPLTPEETEIMRRHPQYAHEMLSPITFLRLALDIPYCHHEKWDGTGYPRGLKSERIPLAARIFAVVDVWDALRSDRPYRPRWPEAKVRDHIRELSGKHFDPPVVEVFLRMAGPGDEVSSI